MASKGCLQTVRRSLSHYTHHHLMAFVLTFASYAFFHANRKTFSNVKTTIVEEWTPLGNISNGKDKKIVHLFSSSDDAEVFMGTLDACFMFAYALGLFFSGFLADRNDLRIVLCIGMTLTSVSVFFFGAGFSWIGVHSKVAYAAMWVINGLVQSTGWPCVVAVMGNWFGKGSRGLVMGFWSACASVGNIIGALMAAAVLDYGYEYAFLASACVLLAGAVINFFGLIPSPLDVGLPPPEEENKQEGKSTDSCENGGNSTTKSDIALNGNQLEMGQVSSGFTPYPGTHQDVKGKNKKAEDDISGAVTWDSKATRPKAINFFTALLLPGVLPYGLCYAFLKLVNYSFFFWLPFYLSKSYNLPETVADKLSIWYDIGGIVGGTLAGLVSDRLGSRSVVVVPMLLLSVPMLFVYGMTDVAGTQAVNGLLLYVLGSLIGGVSNLVSSAISADLGRQDVLRGNAEALSTVTGILDGMGSLGAAVGQLAVPYLEVATDWRAVFYMFMVCVFLTALCVMGIFYREIRQLSKENRCRCGNSPHDLDG